MTRKLVTNGELRALLTAELRKVRDLQGRTVGIIRPLRKPDEDGCNWSADFKVRLGTDIFAKHSDPHVQHIVREARKRFNLKAGGFRP